eukprot:CAMPEP_0168357792 /NCGR_PEP_ID=MMETSP0228-20121227/776_1 /TAXON_ID=133427 /ORGANISM="Protoceratium reticulatum, Strain CCCM 535 (=CCMP 1889)" /LENGTH=306 /DNA_ID=CAMNT_0008370335 /DNA_START=74 /DNA_END=996 /DNA_ORIENTATION=+
MVDPVAVEFFARQLQDSANSLCYDTGADIPEWASVSHGVYLSIGAAGVHRSLGVAVSFVQSTCMDSWKPVHLRMMELGGNQRFAEFLRQHKVPENMPIRQKYSTRAAKWYRENLRAMAEGREPPPPLCEGVGHLPATEAAAATEKVLDRVFAAPTGACAKPAGAPPAAAGGAVPDKTAGDAGGPASASGRPSAPRGLAQPRPGASPEAAAPMERAGRRAESRQGCKSCCRACALGLTGKAVFVMPAFQRVRAGLHIFHGTLRAFDVTRRRMASNGIAWHLRDDLPPLSSGIFGDMFPSSAWLRLDA